MTKTTKTNDSYHQASHCRYLTQYHLVWCPKFRYPVLQDDVADTLTQIISDICDTNHYQIKALSVMPDHVHLFIDCPQTVAPSDIAKTIKSISAIDMFKTYPKLKRFYARCGVLWSRGYFLSTVGNLSAETIQKYIEEQNHEEASEKR